MIRNRKTSCRHAGFRGLAECNSVYGCGQPVKNSYVNQRKLTVIWTMVRYSHKENQYIQTGTEDISRN